MFHVSMTIYQNANALYASNHTAAENLDSTEALAEAFRNGEALNALSMTYALAAGNLLEQNRKTVQRLYLQTLGIGIHQLTPQQLSEAEAIAVQCPSIGDSAVYAARALYRLNIDRVFVDDSLCITAYGRETPKKYAPSVGEIRLVPNPATETVTISGLPGTSEEPVFISLLNTNGVSCKERKVEGSELALSVASLPAGIYFCRVQPDGGKPVVLKLVVSH